MSTKYGIRYRPGTDLARRFPHPHIFAPPVTDRAQADNIRSLCANAEHMEVVAVDDDGTVRPVERTQP